MNDGPTLAVVGRHRHFSHRHVPPMNLYQDDWSIRTYQGQNPPARMVQRQLGNEGRLVNSILGGGVIISGGDVCHSILFSRVRVHEGAVVEDALLFNGGVVASLFGYGMISGFPPPACSPWLPSSEMRPRRPCTCT